MYSVKNEVYYHINTGSNLQVNDTLDIGQEYNNFYYEIYNTEHIKDDKDANVVLLEMLNNKSLSFNDVSSEKLVLNTISDDAMITRELMFEETRKEVDDNLPSRFKCLYVCKSIDEIKSWINIFKRTNKNNYQILKLQLTGTIFVGDASFVLRQNISLNKKKEQAISYWSGCKKDNINEYLFIGKAKVLEIVKEGEINNENKI